MIALSQRISQAQNLLRNDRVRIRSVAKRKPLANWLNVMQSGDNNNRYDVEVSRLYRSSGLGGTSCTKSNPPIRRRGCIHGTGGTIRPKTRVGAASCRFRPTATSAWQRSAAALGDRWSEKNGDSRLRPCVNLGQCWTGRAHWPIIQRPSGFGLKPHRSRP